MFNHLLLPLDGSRLAESVLPYAAFFAQAFEARLTLLHVVEKTPVASVHGDHHLHDAASARTYLDSLRSRLPTGLAMECHVHESPERNVAASIAAHQREFGHDLVVLCSHGEGGLRHLITGSIAQQVVAAGTLPVLFIRPEFIDSTSAYACRSMLAPVDTDPVHEPGLEVAERMARQLHNVLHLVTVVPTWEALTDGQAAASRLMPATSVRMLDLMEEEARAYQERLIVAAGEPAPIGHVLRGNPPRRVLEEADRLHVDLLVVGTHGSRGTTAFWSGSVAPQILAGAKQPVLLVPIKRTAT